MIPILLLVVTASFRPSAPTVGDLITIDFQQPVKLEPSPQYEIVSQHGARVVVRTFEPRPFALSGRIGDVAFRNMYVPMRSVLAPKDNLTPAPLKPPLTEPYPMMPFVVMGIAAMLAIAAWIVVAKLDRPEVVAEPIIPPIERFRASVAAARNWSQLADALREYLAATTLTTAELLHRNDSKTVAEILRQGDLEKFSPWGPKPADLSSLKRRALEVAA